MCMCLCVSVCVYVRARVCASRVSQAGSCGVVVVGGDGR